MVQSVEKRPFNLDQIVTAQEDEPEQAQRNCIYRVNQGASKVIQNNTLSLAPLNQSKNKFTQIRVKSIDFMEESATAIYFYDMTHYVEAL